MLIVVAILAVLMSIVFRLGNIGGEDSRRTSTVVKMQKIENCLSGYYAAFGSYPPVKVHGSRDITCAVNDAGDQDQTKGGSSSLNWAQVNAACRSQPFGCEYPGSAEDNEVIETWAEELQERVSNSQDYPKYAESSYAPIFRQGFASLQNLQGFASEEIKNNPDWKVVKLFKFGVMSFLLPRYLFMMDCGTDYQSMRAVFDYAQWGDNNDVPCDPFEGDSFGDWESVRQTVENGHNSSSANNRDLVRIANIPSQAVCARWMPNLERTCRTLREMKFFGVPINQTDQTGLGLDDEYPPDPGVHTPPHGNKYYKNATITMYDGWSNEFYYYSPAPYQSYSVWSAGPNWKTFPPWMSVDDLNGGDKKTAMEWKNDDIVQMSH